jgi:hypothetical protein
MPRPNFIGIGAQRSGTTFLHTLLKHHPHVALPKSTKDRFNKELHFFDLRIRYYDLEWYEHQFPTRNTSSPMIVGEITPAYCTLPKFYITSIRSYLGPDVKIVLVLRNPVYRVLSHKKMMATNFNRKTPENLSISLKDMIYFCNRESVIRRTKYSWIYNNWTHVFGEQQVHVVGYDELTKNTERAFGRLCTFLQIPTIHTNVYLGSVHSSEKHFTIDPIVYKYLFWKWKNQIRFVETLLGEPLSVPEASDLTARDLAVFMYFELKYKPVRIREAFRATASDIRTWSRFKKIVTKRMR